MKILLIGATGQLGSDLVRVNPGHEIIAPRRAELDLRDSNTIHAAVGDARPDIVINTAAFHNVPLCEEQPETALRVNCIAVRELALACRAAGARFVTFSTDYVFDGAKGAPYEETDRPSPLQVYGISKLAGEMAALAAAPAETVVVRTCGLYGRSGATSKAGNFVDNRVADARRAMPLDMSSEQTVCPTATHDVAAAIYRLLENPAFSSGIYHLVNEGQCSWFEFTAAIYRILRLDVDLRPVDRGGLAGTLRRPLYSVLANTRARALGVRLSSWPDALEKYLHEKYRT